MKHPKLFETKWKHKPNLCSQPPWKSSQHPNSRTLGFRTHIWTLRPVRANEQTPLHHIAPPKPNWLVVLTILKNMSSSMGRIIPYIYIYITENKSHVWNHQPAKCRCIPPLSILLGWYEHFPWNVFSISQSQWNQAWMSYSITMPASPLCSGPLCYTCS